MLIRLTSIIFLLLLFWSCEEVVELDLEFDSKVVVVSEIAPNRRVEVNLSRSRSILSEEPTEYIGGAEVSIENRRIGQTIELFFQKGDTTDTSNPNNTQIPLYLAEERNLIGGSNNYELNVKVAGEEPISAITTIPERVNIQSLNVTNFEKNLDPRVDNQFKINFDFGFIHNPLIANNYHLVAYFIYDTFDEPAEPGADTSFYSLIQTPIVEDLAVESPYTFDFENGVLIQGDDISEGTNNFNVELSVSFDTNFPTEASNPQLIVELRNTNFDYHDYHFKLSRQRSQRDPVLAQAILIPSNINNGLGIFSGYNYDLRLVRLRE